MQYSNDSIYSELVVVYIVSERRQSHKLVMDVSGRRIAAAARLAYEFLPGPDQARAGRVCSAWEREVAPALQVSLSLTASNLPYECFDMVQAVCIDSLECNGEQLHQARLNVQLGSTPAPSAV